MSYISQEGAYEVAVAEAGGDLRTGHEIRIEVMGRYDREGDGSRHAVSDNPPANRSLRRGLNAHCSDMGRYRPSHCPHDIGRRSHGPQHQRGRGLQQGDDEDHPEQKADEERYRETSRFRS
jgi:hypothetical protein